MRLAFIVVGMHRSGTSAMSRLLSMAGAALPITLMPPAPDNITGFWESNTLSYINERILEDLDSSWQDPRAFTILPSLSILWANWHDRILQAVAEEYADAPVIVLKDPRISLLAPLWKPALAAAGFATRFVIMLRNPAEVAASLRARNSMFQHHAHLLWLKYTLQAEYFSRDETRVICSYDEVLFRPKEMLTKIVTGTHLASAVAGGHWEHAARSFLDAKLRHHVAGTSIERDTSIWMPIKDVYTVLCREAQEGSNSIAALEGAARWFEELSLAVEALAEFGTCAAELRDNGGVLLSTGREPTPPQEILSAQ